MTRRHRLPPSPPGIAAFGALAVLIAGLLLLAIPRQALTGDEPRYLMYAVSFFRHGHVLMPLPEWNALSLGVSGLPATALPTGGDGSVLMNGVYLPVLLSPIAGLLSLSGLRLVTLLTGLLGLLALWRLLCRTTCPWPAFAAIATAGLSIPLLPYLHLFYMETFLFALVCWGWLRLQSGRDSLSGDLLTAAILILIPVIHLRGAMVAACLFAFLLRQTAERRLRSRTILLATLALLAGTTFLALNLRLYGVITGPVNTARPPLPSNWFAVLAMQLFNVHHGLLAYAPIWTLGYAGLWFGAWRNLPIARQALLLATIAALTGVGTNPGECWPARFWVLSIPMLTVGLGIWLDHLRSRLAALCLAILLVITLANTILFVRIPDAFLENRQTSRTYAALFKSTGLFDANAILPVEIADPRNRAAARDLALGAGLFVVLMALVPRRPKAAAPALLLLLALLDLSRVQRLPHSIASMSATPRQLRIVLTHPIQEPILHVGHPEQAWFLSVAWFRVTATGARRQRTEIFGATPMVSISCSGGVRSIEVDSDGVDLAAQARYRLTVDRSASLIRGILGYGAC